MLSAWKMTPVPFTSVTMSEQMLTMTPGMLGKTGFSLEHELEVRHQSATYAALRVLVPVFLVRLPYNDVTVTV